MTDNEFRQSHRTLSALYKEIRAQFADLDEGFIEDFLGQVYSQERGGQFREHGDGYTLRPVPTCIDEIVDADKLVLVVMKFPLLDVRSEFNPHVNLTNISYWQDTMGLRPTLDLWDKKPLKCHFWVWQHECPVHGGDESEARENRRRLQCHRPQFNKLVRKQKKEAGHFLSTCNRWLQSQGRTLTVITNKNKEHFDSVITQLIRDPSVTHVPADLYGGNCNIMDLLAKAERTS